MTTIDRSAIYQRDAGICGICGEPVAFTDMDIDHVIHRWRGGLSTPDNMRATHSRCNRRRGPRDSAPDEDQPVLNFVVAAELLRRLDDFRYEHRFPSRAAAVKWLLEEALRRGLRPEKTARAGRKLDAKD